MPDETGLPLQKYQVALSFAGEDRAYVERVAIRLAAEGVSVFYDKFEESTLWGKNLYTHLREVYEEKAVFTVMFISEHYKKKVWTNHERESAQARAFESNKEYILPAFFDEFIKIPGVLKTTGRIGLANRTPEDLAALIVKKLEESGVAVSARFSYSEDAKADVDFPMPKGNPVTKILEALKSQNWYTQSPAIDSIFALDFNVLDKDQIFVLGRNIYQCACGTERRAVAILNDLRAELAKLPAEAAAHLLNGMFYEVYFNSSGEFRGGKIKGKYLEQLLKLQLVKKYASSVSYIRKALEPYKSHLPILPSENPEVAEFVLALKKSDPPLVKSVSFRGKELLSLSEEGEDLNSDVWKLSFVKFTMERLAQQLSAAWSIPAGQLKINCDKAMEAGTEFRLPKGRSISWPKEGL